MTPEDAPPPIPSGWQAAVGIAPGERWAIPGSEHAVFLCVPSLRHRRVIALRAAAIPGWLVGP